MGRRAIEERTTPANAIELSPQRTTPKGDGDTAVLFLDSTGALQMASNNGTPGPVQVNADGASLKTVADANVIGGIPVVFRIDCPDASGNVDVVMTHKVRIYDAIGLNTGIAAHATTDTWQVKNGTDAITDAVAKGATVNAVKRANTINPSFHEIAAGGTLRITTAKTTNAAVTVTVFGYRVA